jgi:hypothetical protein
MPLATKTKAAQTEGATSSDNSNQPRTTENTGDRKLKDATEDAG